MSKSNDAIKQAVDSNRIRVEVETGSIYSRFNRLIGQVPQVNGYITINITYQGRQISCYVHRVVAYVIYGDAVFGKYMVVDHINGDRADNRKDNLRLVTSSENSKNRQKRGIRERVLSHTDIDRMTRLREDGWTYKELGDKFYVSSGTVINAVKRHKAYSNVPGKPANLTKDNKLAGFWSDVDSGMCNKELREKYRLSHSALSRRFSRREKGSE